MATTVPCPLAYSRRRPEISTAAPRRWDFIAGAAAATELAAARMLAVLVLDHERPELLHRVLQIAHVHQPLGGKLRRYHLALQIPRLAVEQSRHIDLPVRAARGPRIFVKQFRPAFRAALDQRIDHVGAERTAV